MTDETASLVLEHLRAIRADIAIIKSDVRGVQTEQAAMRLELRALTLRVDHVVEEIADTKVRLDRIERRLELTEPAE
ncbi:hypothetical protein SAMN05428969_2888 [Devosia sp. YR412]|uniref:hypothetical protein n=1 Tax=Devosia sp. YR412 TaxID=1881030 RepID=UPI0008B26062|nr:hypothetical protein [Devosia sp. YR412]SEQ39172.1 hypothetical protein SAMN05428969_2888 [Devosia sp. YR412]